MEQRDNCKALLQKMEEEHLETITKMKRRIDDLEGMSNKVFAYIYSVHVVMYLTRGRYSWLRQIVFIFNMRKKKFKNAKVIYYLNSTSNNSPFD